MDNTSVDTAERFSDAAIISGAGMGSFVIATDPDAQGMVTVVYSTGKTEFRRATEIRYTRGEGYGS